MVTHDHDVLHHCDRVVEMIDGRLSAPRRDDLV
jgi:putative ABC transport system ATP-binding protein